MRPVTRGRRNALHLGIGARLKEARKAAEYPASYLSRDAGLSDTAVLFIERGRPPRVDTIEALALALGASPCWLSFGIPLESSSMDLQAHGIGARLQQARERAGLDKNALGRAAEITGQTVANIETGRSLPGVDVAEQLARALDVSPCWLAFGEGAPDGPQVPPPIKKKKPAPAPRTRARKATPRPAGKATSSSSRKPAPRARAK